MTRLFRKFFIFVWLAMTVSIVGIISLDRVFHLFPLKSERQQERISFVLQTIGEVLEQKGLVEAGKFAQAWVTFANPVIVSISPVPNLQCATGNDETLTIYRHHDGACFRLSSQLRHYNFIEDALPDALPWIATVIASTLSAYWITRYLVGPVAKLRNGLSALAKGDFHTRIGGNFGKGQDEITALAMDFDVTAARLQELQEAQQRLFHDVSHELRSPLSRLQAVLGMLDNNPGRIDMIASRMGREVMRLDALVDEILTLARISSPEHAPPERQTIDLIDLITRIVDDACFEGQDRGVDVTYSGCDSFIATLNGELIYRAIENVVRNAVKFTTDDSTVAVTAQAFRDVLSISVTDNGPGVPACDLERIFLPFSRSEIGETAKGHGLGLAITRKALELHHGSAVASLTQEGHLLMTLKVPASPGL
ncbi:MULTISPECIES: HAMP domain-containing sensor histidine kinase [Rhizobium/Agrobacterium group]|uniref:HAMP domain-containing sensor histidine kinase n=1 Tax=Rhizobium/Agrobacterium group TaxID=227290 RepID=UPI000B3F9860|nr:MULTISPECIES: ATP-binding protein [Rhizobium/Agrobacterium group]MCF1473596.1 HAMP domain-containing protein [Allorhizobium ampelinum]MCF1485608.1 HAMP domain-containing protein [Allorhizobium ampelinum]MVA51266.1 HAMP domain-containing protein [Agrobacterium vitis]NSZ46033.1 HAMP domain-containing protein [Agrobacterium vitis]NSZ55819.1 HAMP domain-containing protein [Agrobacterium vitis]